MTRLIDMGIEPYLVASSLEGVLAQRLVRTLCPHCREEDHSERVKALRDTMKWASDAVIYQAVGCRECRQTGYHGRRAVFEMMGVSYPIRQKILKNCSSGELKELACKEGMRTLSQDGWRLVEMGITTPDEVMRVTKDEELSTF